MVAKKINKNYKHMEMSETIDLKSYFADMTEINNKRIDDRFLSVEKLISKGSDEQKAAVKSALDAQEKAVNAALTAAKEAVNKAEIAADKRFEDFNGNIENLRKEVAGLRESRSSGSGKDEGSKESRISLTNIILTLIALGSLIVAFLKP